MKHIFLQWREALPEYPTNDGNNRLTAVELFMFYLPRNIDSLRLSSLKQFNPTQNMINWYLGSSPAQHYTHSMKLWVFTIEILCSELHRIQFSVVKLPHILFLMGKPLPHIPRSCVTYVLTEML